MPQIIQIPEPCHEDWNLMTPNEQGRHCAQCAKTVVDFTGWEPAEMIFYLKMNAGACGRFRADQLDRVLPSPEDFVQQIVHSPFSFMKRVAAIFLFVFGLMAGTSCHTTGEPAMALTGDTVVMPATRRPVDTGRTIFSHPAKDSLAASQSEKMGEAAIVEPMVTAGAPIMVDVPDTIINVPDSLK